MKTFTFSGSFTDMTHLLQQMQRQQASASLISRLRRRWKNNVPNFIINGLCLADRVRLQPENVTDVEYRTAACAAEQVPSRKKKRR